MFVNFPVDDKKISQHFGHDTTGDPVYGKFYEIFDNKHCGVDFPIPVGTKVKASFSGIVVRIENHDGMGKVVGVRNGNIVALYAHLSDFYVNLGDIIHTGDLIGMSGCTGKACVAPHLHFELRDISKSSLKEMVFDPPLEREIKQFIDTFDYVVNNKNTQKTLKNLSILYFGTDKKWNLIKKANRLGIEGDALLEDGLKISIPNYSETE